MKKAEIKPFKVGEPLTDNADGNTEPSTLDSSKGACVETRRKVCIKCGNLISQTKYKSAKFCSSSCRSADASNRYKIRKSLIKKPGVGSGNNQWGKDNHQYKFGVGTYKATAFNNLPHYCNRCKSINNLLVHHKDHTRKNNNLENLEILCKRCHQKHHCKRDSFGKYAKV